MNLIKELILGSGSPRRAEILQKAGFCFTTIIKQIDESYPTQLSPEKVPVYLAEQKLKAFISDSYLDKIVLCADTVVILDGEILNKPKDVMEAKRMLLAISGKRHKVVTGVAVLVNGKVNSFSDECLVDFVEIEESEVDFYIKNYSPLDKAGAYGIQDFIGMIGVKALSGSFYTVMGLPIHLVYSKLKKFVVL